MNIAHTWLKKLILLSRTTKSKILLKTTSGGIVSGSYSIPSNSIVKPVSNSDGENYGLIVQEPGKEQATLFCKISKGRAEITNGKPMFGGYGDLLAASMSKNPVRIERNKINGLNELFKEHNVTANIFDGSPSWREE